MDGTDLLTFPRFLIALLVGILAGVITSHTTRPDLAPYAAIAGFSFYLAILFLIYFNRWLRKIL